MKLKTLFLVLLSANTALAQTHPVRLLHPEEWNRKPPQVDPKIKECRDMVRSIEQEFGIYNSDSFCNSKTVDAVLKARKEYHGCISAFLDRSTVRNGLLSKCLSESTRKSFKKNDEFAVCIDETKYMRLGDHQYEACRDNDIRKSLKNPTYVMCVKNYSEAYPRTNLLMRLKQCQTSRTRGAFTSPSYINCKDKLADLGASIVSRGQYCMNPTHQKEAHITDLKICDSKIGAIIGENLSINYCLNTKVPFKIMTDKVLKCVVDTTQILDKDYFNDEEQDSDSLKLFDKFLDSCQKTKSAVAPMKGPLKFYGMKILGQNKQVGNTKLGGLSGLSFNTINEALSVVSDDPGYRDPTRYYEMRIDFKDGLQLIFDKAVRLNTSHVSSKWPKSKSFFNVDAEGIVVTQSGNIIISTETLIEGSKSFLKIYDNEGEQTGEILLSEKFLPKHERVEKVETYMEYPHRNFNFRDNEDEDDQDEQEEEPTKPIERTRHYSVVEQVGGIYANKSLEALAGNEDGSILFTANESPLVQDAVAEKKYVRMVKLVKDKKSYKTQAEYIYEIENFQNNGLVDILYLSEHKVLTLERRYDHFKNKVTAQIFEVDLRGAKDYSSIQSLKEEVAKQPIRSVKKKLLMNLDDILDYLPPVLSKIDNLEGISLGPKLPNGNQSIVLVSDNNFSHDQFTQFIVLEYSTYQEQRQ